MARELSILSISGAPRSVKGQTTLSPLDRSRNFFLVVLGALLAFAILGAICYIGLRVKVVHLGYQINQELQLKERTIEENKRLTLEIARLKSPTRIEAEARETLGLALPQPHQIIYLREKSVSELDVALAKINPLSASPSSNLPKTNAGPLAQGPQVAKAEKKEDSLKTAPTERKSPELPPKRKPVSEKAISPATLTVAIVGDKKSNNKSMSQKNSREAVPAIMLDSLP